MTRISRAIGTIPDVSPDALRTTIAVNTNPVAPRAAWSSDSAHGAKRPRNTELASTSPPTAPIANTRTAMFSMLSLPFLLRSFGTGCATLSTYAITKLPKIQMRLNLIDMDQMSPFEPARSRDRILELLLRSETPMPVQALAAALSISRNAAHQQV